jgi:hypothetical protein
MIGGARLMSRATRLSTSEQIFLVLAIVFTFATNQPLASLVGVLILWAVTTLGAIIVQMLTGYRSSDPILLPVHLVMGYFVVSTFHLAFGSLTRPLGTVLLTIGTAVISRIWDYRQRHYPPALRGEWTSTSLAALAVGACLLNLAVDYPWLLGTALCLLLLAALLLFRSAETHSTRMVFYLLCAIPFAIILFLERPKYWNLQQEEQLLSELLSVSLAHFPGKTPIWSNSAQLNYHWFPYPLAGVIAEVSSFREFVVNSTVLPLAVGSLLFCGVASMLSKHSTPRAALVGTLVIASVSNIGFVGWDYRFLALPTAPNFILAITTAFSLLVIHFPLDIGRIESQPEIGRFQTFAGPLVLSAVCSFLLLGSKIDFALAPIIGLQIAVAIHWVRRKTEGERTRDSSLVTLIGSAIGGLLAAWRVLGVFSPSAHYGAGVDVPRIELSANFMEYWGDLQTLVGRPRMLAAVAVFIGLFCLSVLVLLVSINSTKSVQPLTLSLFAVVVMSMLGTLFLPFGNMSRTFIRSALFMALLQLGLLIARDLKSVAVFLSRKRRLLITCLSIEGLLLSQAYFAWSVRGNGSELAIGIRLTQFLILPIITCALICLEPIRALVSRAKSRQRSQTLILVASHVRDSLRASTLAVCVITGVFLSIHNYVWSFRFSDAKLNSRGSHYVALPAERKVSDFLRERTPQNALIAVDSPRSDLELQRLVIYTERRFLTIGDFWGFNDSVSQTAARNLQLSRSIAFLTVEDKVALREAGVTTLLIRNLDSLARIESILGSPDFLSERFAVFIL